MLRRKRSYLGTGVSIIRDITFTGNTNDWEEESILNLLALLANMDVDVQADVMIISFGVLNLTEPSLLRVSE